MLWEVKPIGKIESPYLLKHAAPRQATIGAANASAVAEGRILLFPGYEACATALEGFDYVWVLSYLHLNSGFRTTIKPQPVAGAARPTPSEVGLFASRAPHRPNPIGLSALRVVAVDAAAGAITVRGLDLLHDTPVLDVKPYVPAFDAFPDARSGWMGLIHASAAEGRERGYQRIDSARGRRAARAHAREVLEGGGAAGLYDQSCANRI